MHTHTQNLNRYFTHKYIKVIKVTIIWKYAHLIKPIEKKKENAKHAFLKLFTFREVDCRFLLLQCHAPLLPESCCSTSLFTSGDKPTGTWGFCFWLLGFWLFGCGRLLEGRIAGGRLLKGENEWLKRNCWREDFWREKNCWRRTAKGKLLKLKREHGTVQVCTENFIHRP
jgi:hypothetical protein